MVKSNIFLICKKLSIAVLVRSTSRDYLKESKYLDTSIKNTSLFTSSKKEGPRETFYILYYPYKEFESQSLS